MKEEEIFEYEIKLNGEDLEHKYLILEDADA